MKKFSFDYMDSCSYPIHVYYGESKFGIKLRVYELATGKVYICSQNNDYLYYCNDYHEACSHEMVLSPAYVIDKSFNI